MRIIMFFFFIMPFLGVSQTNDFLHFESETIDLGKVTRGEKVESAFNFTNVSDEEVYIELVSTCECTEADWPKRSIKPGEKSTISFVFDSSKKDEEEEISVDVYLRNEDKDGNPVAIFLYYQYQF